MLCDRCKNKDICKWVGAMATVDKKARVIADVDVVIDSPIPIKLSITCKRFVESQSDTSYRDNPTTSINTAKSCPDSGMNTAKSCPDSNITTINAINISDMSEQELFKLMKDATKLDRKGGTIR